MALTVGAVLMIGHFVISIFNVPLGQPVITTLPMENMEMCERYAGLITATTKLDIEYSLITKTQCYTYDDFMKQRQAQMDRQNGVAPSDTPKKPAESGDIR